jgi:hypothetical protein
MIPPPSFLDLDDILLGYQKYYAKLANPEIKRLLAGCPWRDLLVASPLPPCNLPTLPTI